MSQTFDPYGNPFASAGPGSSSFGYAGEQTDDNGLVFLRARYYNPRQGRFMQMDPSRQEVNLYGYAAGNPILYTDPSGLSGRWPRFECPADTPDWLCLLMGGTPASAPPVLLTTYYPPTTPADSAAYIGLLALLACVSLVSNAPSLSTRETTLTGNEPMISRPPQHPFEGEDKGPDKEPGPLSPPRDREPRRTLYHGTDPSGAASILTNGINIAAGNPQVDFGQGFYTTDNIEQARNRGNGAIVIFEVSVNELLSLRHLEFTSPDNAWATFVLYHRTTPGVNHNYDWVEGPVARRWSARTGIVTVYQGYHQLSIHTEAARQLFQRSIVGITN
jgi:RHS repeat-associated protein